jgi:membrane fusion protein, macrolide-specific efflux system
MELAAMMCSVPEKENLMFKLLKLRERLHMLPRRNLVIVAVAIIALIIGVIAFSQLSGNGNQAPLAIVTVVQGDVEKTVTSLGKMYPKEYVDVGTQVSGQLKKVYVKIGDQVKKGDMIAEIDPTTYETKVRSDRANIDNLRAQLIQQQAELGLARQQLVRNEGLLKERAASQDTVEQNQSALKVAAAKITALQAQIKAAQATLDGDVANLGYTKIYAPMTGTVVSQTSLEGQTVNASQSAPVIVRVADLQTMTVWAQVAEADVVKVKAGTPVYFSTLGAPEKRWKGSVRQVYPTPETVNDVVLYNVLVDVDNSKQELMLTMTVQMFFVLDEARNVPLVPLNTLQSARNGDDTSYVAQVQNANGIVQRNVKVGVTSRSHAAIVSGLEVGDKVIVPQADAAKSGSVSTDGKPPMGARL